MGDFDLRPPSLGDSLPRARTPHLVEPEELRLPHPVAPPAYVPPGRRPRLEDLMSAVGNYADMEPSTPDPITARRPAPVPSAVRLGSETSGDGVTSASGSASAEVGEEDASRVRATAGLTATRDEAGATSVGGTTSGDVHVERGATEAHLEGTARLGPTAPTGDVEARMSARGDDVGAETSVAVEHVGATPEVSTDTAVRVGPEAGLHGEGAVHVDGLGGEETSATGELAVSHGEHRPRYGVTLGGVLGEHPHSRLGTSFSVAPSEGTSLSLSGTLDDVESGHPTGSASADFTARLNEMMSLRTALSGTALGTPEQATRGGLDLDLAVTPDVTVNLGASGSLTGPDLTRPEAAGEIHGGIRGRF
jgi:hypothetical protein